MSRTLYKAGVLELQGAGEYTVETGFRPRGVVFFGVDTEQVDTIVTSTPRGLFYGQMGELYSDSSTIVSTSVEMRGSVNQRSKVGTCFIASDNGGATTIEASPVSMDATGFTINVSVAPSAARYVHWWVWGGTPNAGSYLSRTPGSPPSGGTLTLGYRFLSGMALLYHPNSSDDTFWVPSLYTGTTHWPADVDPLFSQSGLSGASILGVGNQGYVESWNFTSSAGDGLRGAVVEVLDAVGPFVNSGFRYMRPSGTTDIELSGGGSSFYEMHSWWDGEGWTDMRRPGNDTGNTATYVNSNPNFDVVALTAFSHVSGERSFGSFGGDGRFGYGVVTRSHQSCCVVAGNDGKMYQSLDKCVAKVDATGLHTATGAFAGGDVVLTTVDATTTPSEVVAHMFGPPGGTWVPQVYRRRVT